MLMPDLTGVDVFSWIVAHHPELARRVIFMTGGTLSSAARATLDAADGRFLAKPFGVDELRRAIERAREAG
jgi:DNA-binding NtrC family response regulator